MKSFSSFSYKILTAFLVVMLALAAMPMYTAQARPLEAPITFIDNIGAAQSKTTGTTLIITTTAVVAAGDAIFVAFVADDSGSDVVTVTDQAGNVYSQIAFEENNGDIRSYIYASFNVTALPSGNTITITHANMTARAATASVFSGLPATVALAVDEYADDNGNSTNPDSSNTGTTDQADELLIGIVGTEGPSGDTAGTWLNSFTNGPRSGTTGGFSDSNVTVSFGYRIVTATGVYAAEKSGVSSRDWSAAIVTLRRYFIPTTVAVTSDINPSTSGQLVTFTATVAPAAATGTVTFRDGATPIGSGTLAGGIATFSTSALGAGPHNITAVYGGDADYAGSTSAVFIQNVNAPPAIISANNDTFTVLTADSFTVLASGNPASTFSTAGPLPGGVTLTPAGVLAGTPASGTSGGIGVPFLDWPFVITATNGVNPDATQDFILRVQKRNQTINFNAQATAQYGTTFNVNPTANSGLAVTLTSSGGCTNVGFAVTMTSATVNCVLTASQGGNIDYNPAANVSDTVTAQQASTMVSVLPSPHTFTNPSQSFYSHPMTFSVTVSSAGGIPTGTVTLTGGSPNQNITVPLVNGQADIPIGILNVQTLLGAPIPHGLNIEYNGDANFDNSDEDVSHVIYPAPTTTTVTSNINPSAVGQTVTFTVTVSTNPPGSGTPLGTVILYDGATPISGALTLTGGLATFNTSALLFGSHTITARYTNTSDNFATSNSANYIQNVRRATTTTLVSNNNPSVYGEDITFTSTTTSTTPGTITGSVSFYDGATLLGTDITIVGGAANFTINSLVVGTHPITAVYSGDGTYATSTSAILNQVVDKATLNVTADDQTITYGDADPPFTFTYGGFVLGETAAVIDTPPTCTVIGVHVNVGTYDIECSGGLDNNYTFNFIDGTLTVAQKTLTITADNRGKVFGDTVVFAGTEFTTNGLIFGDTVTSVTLNSAGAPAGATVAGSPYPIIPSAAVGTGLTNYNIVYVNGLLTIGTNILTITAADQTKTYGDVFNFTGNPPEFTVTGLQGADTVTSVTLTSSGSPSAAVVGTYPIVPSVAVGSGLGNYTIIYNPGQMTVSQRALSFNPNDQTKVYGSVFSAYTGAFTGLRVGDNITPVYDSLGAPASALVGTYPITVTLDDPDGKLGNYVVTIDPAPAATLTVTQKPLTITAANQSKPYGTDFIFAGTEFTTAGLTNGDTVTSVTLASLGAPAAAVAGTYSIVPSAAIGTGLGNYTIGYNDGTMTVTKPDLIVTSDGQTKIYGDVFNAFTGSIVGIQNGDNITATYASAGSPAAAPFGPYSIDITLVDPDGKLINYNVIQNVGILSVVKRGLTVVADDKTKLYGDPVTLTGTLGGAGVVPGDNITFTYSSAGTALTAPVGTYSIAITLNDPLNRISNYNYAATPGTLTVTLRDLVVAPDNQFKEYGTWFLAFTGTITGIQNGENITANYASAGSPPSAVVGPHPITTTLNDPTGKLGNYNVIINPATLTVGSSILTVTANNQTIIYGSPDPAFTFNYFGFAAGDTPAVINTPPTCTVTGPHTDVGTYPIVCSGGVDDAYTFDYVAGILTVTPRDLIITSVDKVKTYGALFTAFTGSVTGAQFGEVITAAYDSLGAPVTAGVGSYPINITLTPPAATLTNYNVIPNIGTLTVDPRDLTVTPADKTKVYGDVFTAFTGTITGIQNGEAITAIYSSPGAVATATVAGSPYPITAVLNAPAGVLANYTITTNTGNLDVTLRTLVVTPDNQAKVFGTVFNAFTGVISGLQAGDNITATYASAGSPAAALVGTYPITATLNDPDGRLPNYAVTLNTGTLNVALSVLNVTAENKIIVYGDPDPAFTFTYTGFILPDDATVIDTQPSCQVSVPHNNVGTFPIVCSGGVDNNYAFSYTPGTLTVTSRALSVTPDNKTKLYGDLFTTFTGVVTGIQGADNITANYASAGAPAVAAVGDYQITATLNDPGNRLSNYTISLNTGTLTVNQRPLTVTPNNASKIYGNVFNTFTGTIVGIQNGDAITATYSSPGSVATATVAGSPYTITAVLNAPAGVLANYNVTNNTGTLTVTQRDLVIQPADKTKTFGTVFSAFTGSIVGIQNGDAITATYSSTGAPAAAAVGTYPITAVANAPAGVLANYNVSIGGATLTVSLSTQTITITTPAPNNGANGSSFTVAATASSGLAVTYSATGSCTNVGPTFTITLPNGNCIVHYNQAGDTNFSAAPELTENVSALPNSQTITVVTSAPAVASPASVFDVEATASSGLIVSITASGVCTIVDHGDGTATITIVAPNGSCVVHYNQAGNATFASAPQITESITIDSNAPTVTVNQEAVQTDPTNLSPINFTVIFNEVVTGFIDTDVTINGTAGATTAVVTGAGATYNVAVSGMTTDGTVIISIPAGAATDIAGNNNVASTSTDNSVTYFDGIGPNVQLLNTAPETTDHVLTSGEIVTFNITHLKVKFNQDVYNPAGDSDPDDVTNPNNYLLIRDLGDTPGVQTVSCLAGADVPADTSIAIGTVTYDSETSIATFTINGGLPLSNGDYHLFVCGTTSIVDPLVNTLALVGSSGLPGSDYRHSFTVSISDNGGGGDGDADSGNNAGSSILTTTGALIPVTGFNPNEVTMLPAQPEDKAYASMDNITIEIPSLGIKFPIVGVMVTKNGWDLTWLKDNVGYLENSAYPTYDGNTVLTAHVRDASKNLGPFSDIKGLKLGDRILLHAYGKIYVYEVQENKKIKPNDISTAFKHEEYSWVTLITCEDYNAKIEEYYYRRMVRAVLISVVPEQ